ncbi:uncharacterized protein LOC105202373 [Solenopsis invicta]|uniref:uncharacterized protein LOC105202373 n=1 Tax=Solenopsis invicta TaxID=13686 RepID=UPI000595F225|nr:uncharacterized protein LOC105202373 [Solenopsis invicta]
MNLLAFGLILICSHAWAIVINDNFEVKAELASISSKLKDALNGPLREAIKNGDSGLGIPPMDPFTADEMPIKINAKALQTALNGELTNVRAEDLSKYTVNSASFKLFGLKLHMDLSWPLVSGSSNYIGNGTVLNHEIYGNGEMNGNAQNLRFVIDIKFKLKKGYARISTISSSISLGALDFHATGLYHDDERSKETSILISNRLPKLIQERQKDFTNYINDVITVNTNQYLSSIKLKELLKKLGL